MKRKTFLALLALVFASFADSKVVGQPLDCLLGSSSRWGSGWCDIEAPITLAKGKCLKLLIGGTANKVIIRVLRAGEDPNEPIGLLLGCSPTIVPNNKEIMIRLERTYSNVVQISVHGGRRAWQCDLGSNNGPAKLLMVEQVECRNTD